MDDEAALPSAKRARSDAAQTALVAVHTEQSSALIATSDHGSYSQRASTLESPIMVLEGHGAAVTGLAWHPGGKLLASCSKDRSIFLWNVQGSCSNTAVLKGHKNAVLDVDFILAGDALVSASADKNAFVWDPETGQRIRKLSGHSKIINSVCGAHRGGSPLIVTGSDDGNAIVWDARYRGPVHTLRAEGPVAGHAFPVLAVAFGLEPSETVFTAGIENVIRQWDLRKGSKGAGGSHSSLPSLVLPGHSDSVTGMALHPQGTHLLSMSMDNTLRAWDVRPFCAAPSRCTRTFLGAGNSFESLLLRPSWSSDGERVACGSADRRLWVWEYESGEVEYCLPGHAGAVTAAAFNPVETPVIASSGVDKKVYLGELERPVEAQGQGGGEHGSGGSGSAQQQDEEL